MDRIGVRSRPAAPNVDHGPRWYAVHTHANAEKVAALNIERQGFQVFLPLRKRTIRHARQVKTVNDAYFPRYLFVRLDLCRDRWLCVRSTTGVVHLVGIGGRPLPIGKGLVEALISATRADGVLRAPQELAHGQRVRLLQGPFAELIGRLVHVGSDDAVLVMLSMMEREVPLKVARNMIGPVSSQLTGA